MRLASFTIALIVLASISEASIIPSHRDDTPDIVKFLDQETKSGEVVDLDDDLETVSNETTTIQITVKPKVTTVNPKVTKPKELVSYIVPLEQWHCGAEDADKWFAHFIIENDCPAKMIPTNDCCLVHDICYSNQLPQDQCDSSFCQCLDRVLRKDGCGHIATTYCKAVELFGHAAHRGSNNKVETSTKSSTTLSTTLFTTIEPSTTTEPSTPLIKKVEDTEKYVFQRTINQTLDHSCFEEPKQDKCSLDLNSCDDQSFTCIYKFCECSHDTLFSGPNLKRLDCLNNLKDLCGKYFVKEVDYVEINTGSWIEEKFGLSVVQAVIIIICLLVSFGSALFWLVHYVCRRRKLALSKGFINDGNSSSNSSSASFFNFMSDDKDTASPLNCMPLLGP